MIGMGGEGRGHRVSSTRMLDTSYNSRLYCREEAFYVGYRYGTVQCPPEYVVLSTYAVLF